ncbi:MAG: hypothetical protein JOY80_07055 [Candidatus Dormibacteraeota bacterium]|nr:hypothetical protein [Candidatus Dormibacteraeota bacterium]
MTASITLAGLAVLPGTAATHARAAGFPCPTLTGTLVGPASTQISPASGAPFTLCTYRVRTFDGTPLDVDVSIPNIAVTCVAPKTVCPPPLMIFQSGWSDDKTQFESNTLDGDGTLSYHWNNAWFASQDVVSLNYTPRGWFDSCGKVAPSQSNPSGYSYANDSTCSDTTGEESWVHLYDRRWEIHDAQYLAGLLVDAGTVDPLRIATSGDSGGGGPSWDMALSQNTIMKTTCTDSTGADASCYAPWTSPNGTAMRLVAAIPHYTWTDLVDALLNNGTASDGYNGAPANGNHQSPVGVDKESYVDGLYALGLADAQYAAPGADPTADLQSWYPIVQAGEPGYDTNPMVPTILQQVGGAFRSPIAIPLPPVSLQTGKPAIEIPVFSIQGFTDPLFNGLHTLDMFNRLKALDSAYPVWTFFGDVGHSYAQNPHQVWVQAHAEANDFLTAAMAATPYGQGMSLGESAVTVVSDTCAGQTAVTYTGTTLAAIPTSVLTYSSAAAQNTTSAASTAEGASIDPIANSGCPQVSASTPADAPQATYSFSVTTSSFTLMGGPVVNVAANLAGTNAELAARLYDVDPSGTEWVVSRSVVRLDEGTAPTTTANLAFELWPNAWQFQCGHTIKLELTQVDAPTWRPDNESSSMTLSNLSLKLPAVTGASCLTANTAESPLAPLLPLAAIPGVVAIALLRRRRRLSER